MRFEHEGLGEMYEVLIGLVVEYDIVLFHGFGDVVDVPLKCICLCVNKIFVFEIYNRVDKKLT